MRAAKLTCTMLDALEQLPVELGAGGDPHPNVLRALVKRGLARLDHGANDQYNGLPPDVRRTDAGDAALAAGMDRAVLR